MTFRSKFLETGGILKFIFNAICKLGKWVIELLNLEVIFDKRVSECSSSLER